MADKLTETVEQIARFVEGWNGATADGDTNLIAEAIRERFGAGGPALEDLIAKSREIDPEAWVEADAGRHTRENNVRLSRANDQAREQLAAALSRPNVDEMREALEALGKHVCFSAYSASVPGSIRFDFASDADRVAAANALDVAFAALRGSADNG